MTTVDLSFEAVSRSLGLDDVVYWRLWDQSEWRTPVGGSSVLDDGSFADEGTGLVYRNLRGRLDEFLDADAVVYWGDFLHMAFYLEANVDTLSRRMGITSRAQAREIADRTLLLAGQSDDVLARVMSFGTTLSFNTADDYRSDYGDALRSFAGRAHRVWFRDTYSAWIAQLAGANAGASAKGVDAAFLLPPGPSVPSSGRLGVFFGRSALSPETLARLGRQLATSLDLRPRWIPWGHEPAFWPVADRRRFRLAWPGLELEELSVGLGTRLRHARAVVARTPAEHTARLPFDGLVARVAACDVVVTDTYHLAVNAWRLGIPAVCVVDRPPRIWSVNSGSQGTRRDKREELYSQLDASELLVSVEDLASHVRETVARIADRLADRAAMDFVLGRVRQVVTLGHELAGSGIRSILSAARV
ncbi:hypothetical protein V5D56_19065 [Cellulosimicrobium sp. PMB13]|uniref:hypothetical protein n=1 Tax=Cellulosimicrobium sp. PMB13 TaxID=3120158 RepID=UPI003F4BF1C7